MATQEKQKSKSNPEGSNEIATVIQGSVERPRIETALRIYAGQLEHFAFPELNTPPEIINGAQELREAFRARMAMSLPVVTDIIESINGRAQEVRSRDYHALEQKDQSLWKQDLIASKMPLFGVLACVDKGIPAESLTGPGDTVGRTLAGDIDISYSPSHNSFVPRESPIVKRLIHLGRMGDWIAETLIEHTSCGRRIQILGNEHGHQDIPSLTEVFDHVQVLANQFEGNSKDIATSLSRIQQVWHSYPQSRVAVQTPDEGMWTGIVTKVAQRQALRNVVGPHTNIPVVIESYNKKIGNLTTGLDALDVLTHQAVIQEGGFTEKALQELLREGRIFSMASHVNAITPLLETVSGIRKGAKTYEDLQNSWFTAQSDLVTLTEALWHLYRETENESPVRSMVNAYVKTIQAQVQRGTQNEVHRKAAINRYIHHLFHEIAFTYLFDTLTRGNVPGVHHIENHLAIGDPDIGTTPFLSLGQGDLETPSAAEIFTGYTVLLHSKPGKEEAPVVVMIKSDTERPGDQPMTTEETRAAFTNFREFLKLWPYFLVGDMIPILSIRGKIEGGVSRLGLSVVLTYGDIASMLERTKDKLPEFVYASNSQGEVVIVPAREVLNAGIQTKDEGLKTFRDLMKSVADQYSNTEVQRKFNE